MSNSRNDRCDSWITLRPIQGHDLCLQLVWTGQSMFSDLVPRLAPDQCLTQAWVPDYISINNQIHLNSNWISQFIHIRDFFMSSIFYFDWKYKSIKCQKMSIITPRWYFQIAKLSNLVEIQQMLFFKEYEKKKRSLKQKTLRFEKLEPESFWN